jgi:phosphonate transport system substrate-binding protein
MGDYSPDRRSPLHIATFLAPALLPFYAAVSEQVGKRIGRAVSVVAGTSYHQFATGEIDAGFICGLPYVQLMRRAPSPVELLAAPVVEGARYGGRPIYFSDVIVRTDSPFHAFADLKGHSWSFTDVDSHSGHNVTLFRLVEMGSVRGFFGPVVRSGSHRRSIELVAAGEVEASAIDSHVLAVEMRDRPELRKELRVIDSLGPSPIEPVVASARLAPAVTSELREALLSLHEDAEGRAALALGLVSRFASVTDSDYDPIRRMTAAVEAAGLTNLR